MSKRSRSRANIPIHREPLFWILPPVFCLLPLPPILPRLPRIHESIMQNKPNSFEAINNATCFSTRVYANKRPRSARKKQSQSNPIPPPPNLSILHRPPSEFCSVTSVLPHREYDIPVRRSTCDIRYTRCTSRFGPALMGEIPNRGTPLIRLCGCVLVGFLVDFGGQ